MRQEIDSVIRRHVIKDLRPYVCTYQDCTEGDLQYDNIQDWISHEISIHRDKNLRRPDPSEQFSQDHRQNQSSHVITPHDISCQECPFCLKENPTFVHIGRHLQNFAVFTLPKSMDPEEDNTLEARRSDIAIVDSEDSISDLSEFEYLSEGQGHADNVESDRNESGARAASDVAHVEATQEKSVQHATTALQQRDKTTAREPDTEIFNPGLGSDVTSLHVDRATTSLPNRTPLSVSTANISFFVQLNPLVPNYPQPVRYESYSFWAPPNVKTGYTRKPGYVFRWMNGNMTHIRPDDPIGRSLHHVHSAATVFTQTPDTPHLLVVPFDAQRTNVVEYPGGWRPLFFHHMRIDKTRRYSAVSANGDCQHIAAPGLTRWMPQLLPPVYDYQSGSGSARIQAGLIGSLPLLIALAAFSAPPNVLVGVITNCIQPMAWRPHQFQYPSGRKCHPIYILCPL